MRRIYPEAVLVFLVVAVVAITDFIPKAVCPTQAAAFNQVDEMYLAPAVPKSNQQADVDVLKIELRELAMHRSGRNCLSEKAIADTVQSYNAIAGQINTDVLERHSLPRSLN